MGELWWGRVRVPRSGLPLLEIWGTPVANAVAPLSTQGQGGTVWTWLTVVCQVRIRLWLVRMLRGFCAAVKTPSCFILLGARFDCCHLVGILDSY